MSDLRNHGTMGGFQSYENKKYTGMLVLSMKRCVVTGTFVRHKDGVQALIYKFPGLEPSNRLVDSLSAFKYKFIRIIR